jgi:arylsulfatase A-like enzyme
MSSVPSSLPSFLRRRTRALLASLLLAAGLSVAPQGAAGAGEDPGSPLRPNIVFIVADDLGWGDVGYHASEMRTPNLDRLVREGVELDQFYVQPQCTPTRVALLTGRYPSRFGAHCTEASNEQALPAGTLTLASLLGEAGYRTAITGKWHLGSKREWGPRRYGFDQSYGSLAGAVGAYDHRYRPDSPYAQTWHRDDEFTEDRGHATDLVAQEAVSRIKEHVLRDSRERRPLFLYVAFHAVHVPLVEEEKWLEANRHIESRDRRLFAAAVTHLDHAVGEIVGALEKSDLRKKTLIIFTSDNGGLRSHVGGVYPPPDPELKDFSSNAPLRGWKSQVYEGGIRVPAFASWPGVLAPRKVTAPLHAVDWMPTLARLLELAPPPGAAWDGRDIWPLLSGAEASPAPRRLYWNWGRGKRLAVREGDWKLLRPGRGKPFELYDLAADPFEATDLATSEPARLEALRAALREERQRDADALSGASR